LISKPLQPSCGLVGFGFVGILPGELDIVKDEDIIVTDGGYEEDITG